MIIGLGLDIVSIDRVGKLVDSCEDQELERLFSPRERAYCESMAQPHPHFAARFAAKEAFVKALGTGMTAGLRWCDVEIVRHGSGRPELALKGQAAARMAALGADKVHVSLSHDTRQAVAIVVLEKMS